VSLFTFVHLLNDNLPLSPRLAFNSHYLFNKVADCYMIGLLFCACFVW